tara:strand:- start:86 stop:1273 length:1188 start_codon:yes stop_codon:yes gene_type:complete
MREERSPEAMKRREEYRKSIGRNTVPPGSLAEQVKYGRATTDMRVWRTPTTMDSKEDSLKHATKLLQGKNLRATGSRIQITLADEVMVEEIRANPELMEQYKDYEMLTRKNLPEQQEFVDYMREQTSVKELFEKTGITKTTIEHWFRRDKAGFSHPSIEDWEKIKPHLKTIKYDNVMTALHSIEWKREPEKMFPTPRANEPGRTTKGYGRGLAELIEGKEQIDPKSMWPTPTTKGFGHASEGQTMIMRKKVEAGELTEEEAQAMMNGTTLRPPRMKKWMWPTPKASGQEKLDTLIKRKGVKAAVQHNLTAAVEMWPTPNARDWKDSVNKVPPSVGKTRGHSLGMKVAEVQPSKKIGGSLNPTWVEWLMGYPAEYTDLKHWETLSSHKSSKKSAKR